MYNKIFNGNAMKVPGKCEEGHYGRFSTFRCIYYFFQNLVNIEFLYQFGFEVPDFERFMRFSYR